MNQRETSSDWIVGPDIPDQERLRPTAPIEDLGEFIEFLDDLEALFGLPEEERPLAIGVTFRL